MKLELRKKCGNIYAVRVEGRQLAPAICVFDNTDEIEEILADCYVSVEEIGFNEKNGIVSWPGGWAGIGDYLVCDEGVLRTYRDLDELREDFEVVA